jgi:hypothetical protein
MSKYLKIMVRVEKDEYGPLDYYKATMPVGGEPQWEKELPTDVADIYNIFAESIRREAAQEVEAMRGRYWEPEDGSTEHKYCYLFSAGFSNITIYDVEIEVELFIEAENR